MGRGEGERERGDGVGMGQWGEGEGRGERERERVPEQKFLNFREKFSIFTLSPFSREFSPFLAFRIVPDCSPRFYNTALHGPRTGI